MNETDIAFAPASEQARLIRRKSISPVELVDLCYSRIERLNPELSALLALDEDRAKAAADRAGDGDSQWRAARATSRNSGRHQRQRDDRGHRVDLGVALDEGPCASGRLGCGREAEVGGRDRAGQNEHAGLGADDSLGESARRSCPQPVGSRPNSWRFQLRIGRRSRGGAFCARLGHRRRRFHPGAGKLLRSVRNPADTWGVCPDTPVRVPAMSSINSASPVPSPAQWRTLR